MDIFKYFLNSSCFHRVWQPSPGSPLLGRRCGAEPPGSVGFSGAPPKALVPPWPQPGVKLCPPPAKPPVVPWPPPALRLPPGHGSPVRPPLGFCCEPVPARADALLKIKREERGGDGDFGCFFFIFFFLKCVEMIWGRATPVKEGMAGDI